MKELNVQGLLPKFIGRLLNLQRVKTDYDRSVNFDVYKTYSWKNVDAHDSLLVAHVMKAIDELLSAKGLKRVPWDGSISLFAMAAVENHENLRTFLNAVQCDWRWNRKGNGNGTVDKYGLGLFVLEMLDTQTKRLVWRGSSSETLSNRTARTLGSLEKTFKKMLKRFPPRARWMDEGIRYLP